MNLDVYSLPNGTKSYLKADGTTMYQCHYCEVWFEPNRRFVQKFCTESCRVMACRERKNGLYGISAGTIKSRNKTTNTELYNAVDELRLQVKELKRDNAERNSDSMEQINKIKRNQDWHIFLTCTIPLIAPKLSKAIGNLFANNKANDLEDFSKKVEPILKNAPEELREQIMSVTSNYFKQDSTEKKENDNPSNNYNTA
jgi:hypothetical protein